MEIPYQSTWNKKRIPYLAKSSSNVFKSIVLGKASTEHVFYSIFVNNSTYFTIFSFCFHSILRSIYGLFAKTTIQCEVKVTTRYSRKKIQIQCKFFRINYPTLLWHSALTLACDWMASGDTQMQCFVYIFISFRSICYSRSLFPHRIVHFRFIFARQMWKMYASTRRSRSYGSNALFIFHR